jgi:hypothetical protein
VTGIVLVVPLAIMYLEQRSGIGRSAAWLLAVPTGLASYLGFLAAKGYGWLSPFSGQLGPSTATA